MFEFGKKKVITRFPPSPTGNLHVGSVRTAMFNYLYAKQNGGKMVFRIEDTDKERSKKEYEKDIIEGLDWLGIEFDKTKIIRQSERGEIYKKYLNKLIGEGKAYVSKEENQKIEGRPIKITENLRAEVIRFKNPNKVVKFTDIIRGEIEFDTTELGDFIIAKSLDEPLYHLTVVVDDFEMGITHLIRGEDHISNTPRQILIQEAIGAPRPEYAHLPLILAPDRSKLSKRHGAVSVSEYKKMGYLPEALFNYLILLGWNPGTDQEIFSLDELLEQFDLTKVQKGGAIFSLEKLGWVNKEYIKKMDDKDFKNKIENLVSEKMTGEMLEKIIPIIKERIETLGDVKKMSEAGEWDYLFNLGNLSEDGLLWKDDGKDIAKRHISSVINMLDKISEKEFTTEKVKETIWDYASEQGRGSVLWPMRFALSGRDKSPDPFTLAEVLGKEETLSRLKLAKENLN